jgi:Na+/proline symporter
MRQRLGQFLVKVARVLLILCAMLLILGYLQFEYKLFDTQLAAIMDFIASVDARVSGEVLTGLSLGTLGFVLLASILPVFSRKIHRRSYLKAMQRGILSAFVFFVSTAFYNWAETLTSFYLIVSIVAVIIVTLILIEALSLAMREEEEVSFRTDIVASITSGLLFGVLLKLAGIGIDMIKHLA